MYATRSLDQLLEQAHKKGENVGTYMERLFDGPLPWSRMRQGYQLVRLCDRYGSERVDAACARALTFDVVDVPRVARLLRRAFEQEATAEDRGDLAQLCQHPRFGRQRDAFRTRRGDTHLQPGDE